MISPDKSAWTPADIMQATAETLAAWAGARGMAYLDTDSVTDIFALFAARPETGVVAAIWYGDEPQAQRVTALVTNNVVKIGISRPKNPMQPAAGKYDPATVSRPLLAAVSDLRSAMLSMRPDPKVTEGWWRYGGASLLAGPDGVPLDAYELTFRLRTTCQVDDVAALG